MKFIKNLSFHRWNYSTILLFAILVPSFAPVLPMHPTSEDDDVEFVDHEQEIEQFLEERQGENRDQYLTRLNVVCSFLLLQKEFVKKEQMGILFLKTYSSILLDVSKVWLFCRDKLGQFSQEVTFDSPLSNDDVVGCLSLSKKQKDDILKLLFKPESKDILQNILKKYLQSKNSFLRKFGLSLLLEGIASENKAKASLSMDSAYCTYAPALLALMSHQFFSSVVEKSNLTLFSDIFRICRRDLQKIVSGSDKVRLFSREAVCLKVDNLESKFFLSYCNVEKKLDYLYNRLSKKLFEKLGDREMSLDDAKMYKSVFPGKFIVELILKYKEELDSETESKELDSEIESKELDSEIESKELDSEIESKEFEPELKRGNCLLDVFCRIFGIELTGKNKNELDSKSEKKNFLLEERLSKLEKKKCLLKERLSKLKNTDCLPKERFSKLEKMNCLLDVLNNNKILKRKITEKQTVSFICKDYIKKQKAEQKKISKIEKERVKKEKQKRSRMALMEQKRMEKQARKQRSEALRRIQIRFDEINEVYSVVVEMGIRGLKNLKPKKLKKKTPIYLKIMKDVLVRAGAYKKVNRKRQKIIEDKIVQVSKQDQEILELIGLRREQEKSKSISEFSVVPDEDVLSEIIMEYKKKDDFVLPERDGSFVKKETESFVEIPDPNRNATIRLYRSIREPLKVFKFGIGDRIERWNRGEMEIDKIIEKEYDNLEGCSFPVCRSGKEFVVDSGQKDLRRKMFIFHHNFARCVDKYIFKLGIQARWWNVTKQRYEINISIPGEVEYDDGSKESGVFTYAFFEENERMVCYHRCFTHMIKKRLLQDLFNQDYWNVHPDGGDNFEYRG